MVRITSQPYFLLLVWGLTASTLLAYFFACDGSIYHACVPLAARLCWGLYCGGAGVVLLQVVVAAWSTCYVSALSGTHGWQRVACCLRKSFSAQE